MKTEIKVCLRIRGFSVSPEEVSRIVGMTPSDTWEKGRPTRLCKTVHKENGWEIDSGAGKDENLSSHLIVIQEKILKHKKALSALSDTCTLELVCVIYSYGGDRPEIHFEKDFLKELSEVGAAVDIDLYFSGIG